MSSIRTLAIAIIKNAKGQLLLHEGYDSVKKEYFYRPLGGGIEFGEKGEEALIREFREEINQEIKVLKYLNTFENLFTYEGKQGHQIILLYEAELVLEPLDNYPIVEFDKIIGQAVWKSFQEIQNQKAKLVPTGIETYV